MQAGGSRKGIKSKTKKQSECKPNKYSIQRLGRRVGGSLCEGRRSVGLGQQVEAWTT